VLHCFEQRGSLAGPEIAHRLPAPSFEGEYPGLVTVPTNCVQIAVLAYIRQPAPFADGGWSNGEQYRMTASFIHNLYAKRRGASGGLYVILRSLDHVRIGSTSDVRTLALEHRLQPTPLTSISTIFTDFPF
jgi:hypothetical protein